MGGAPPKPFTIEALGYYDGLYGRESNPEQVVPKRDRPIYSLWYSFGSRDSQEKKKEKRK